MSDANIEKILVVSVSDEFKDRVNTVLGDRYMIMSTSFSSIGKVFLNYKPDVLLVDLSDPMVPDLVQPAEDGNENKSYNFFSFLKKYVREAGVPIIIASRLKTAKDQYELIKRSYADDHLPSHPLMSNDLRLKMKIWLKQKREKDKERRKTDQIKKDAVLDGLTRVYTRKYFDEQLELLVGKCSKENISLVCIMLDLDNFKEINDKYGHQAGDKVLENVAAMMAEGIREKDILARYGGEEFVLLLPDTSEEDAVNIAERIRNRVQKHNIVIDVEKEISVRVTVSMGISYFSLSGLCQKILNEADCALREAKRTGKNKVLVWGKINMKLDS